MPEVVRTYKQKVPALRFIGKQYGDDDRVDGGFGRQWEQWFSNGWFDALEKACPMADFEDAGAYIGLMRWKENEPFQYWVGMFFPEGTPVPEGFAAVDFPAATLGVAWLYGREGEVYGMEDLCAESCRGQGMKIIPDQNGAYWFFERYTCPRFTTPDEQGNIILDICHFVEG